MSLSEIVGAISSVGTLSLAIFAYLNIFKPTKPRLRVFHGCDDEFLSTPPNCMPSALGISEKCYLYRLKVINLNNVKSAYARNVYLRFMLLEKKNGNGEREALAPFNPFLMRWTSGYSIVPHTHFYNNMARGNTYVQISSP